MLPISSGASTWLPIHTGIHKGGRVRTVQNLRLVHFNGVRLFSGRRSPNKSAQLNLCVCVCCFCWGFFCTGDDTFSCFPSFLYPAIDSLSTVEGQLTTKTNQSKLRFHRFGGRHPCPPTDNHPDICIHLAVWL